MSCLESTVDPDQLALEKLMDFGPLIHSVFPTACKCMLEIRNPASKLDVKLGKSVDHRNIQHEKGN